METFGPVVTIRAGLADRPDEPGFERQLLEFALRANSGAAAGPAEYRYEYLLVVARKRD